LLLARTHQLNFQYASNRESFCARLQRHKLKQTLPPDFDIETESAKKTIEPNEKVAVLKCSQINANPTPIVTWKKDGVDVRNINLDSNVMHVTGKVYYFSICLFRLFRLSDEVIATVDRYI